MGFLTARLATQALLDQPDKEYTQKTVNEALRDIEPFELDEVGLLPDRGPAWKPPGGGPRDGEGARDRLIGVPLGPLRAARAAVGSRR